MSEYRLRVMGIKDVMAYLNCSQRYVYLIMKRGELRSFKIAGKRVTTLADLEDYVQKQREKSE